MNLLRKGMTGLWLTLSFPTQASSSVRLGTPPITSLLLNAKMLLLNEQKYVVWPDFLIEKDVIELLSDLECRFAAGDMADAAVKGPTGLYFRCFLCSQLYSHN